jgi:hypothetical protein
LERPTDVRRRNRMTFAPRPLTSVKVPPASYLAIQAALDVRLTAEDGFVLDLDH